MVATPTILVIDPLASRIGLTFAPTRGAYPEPVVEPKEIGIPPLGNSFLLISYSDLINVPSVDVIPENTTLVTPVAPLPVSIILKLFAGLLSVVGVWNIH